MQKYITLLCDPFTDTKWYKDMGAQRHRSPDNTMTLIILLASEIPGMLNEKRNLRVFPLHTVARYDSAFLKFTVKLTNL